SFYTYTAMVVDRAGNTSAESNSIRFKVDTSTITQTTTIDDVTDNQTPVTGSVPNDGSTNDTSPLLSGTISAPLNAGETLQVLRDGALVGTATVTGTTWTFEDTGLADGDYTYQVRIINAATVTGGQSNQYTIHVDTAVPAQTVDITGYADDEAPKEGTFAFSVPTNDTTPQLQGTLSATLAADEVVVIYRDGVRLGTASVVGGTNWTYQDSGLADGTSYSYTARVEDLAGNRGPSSAAATLRVDTTAPATPAAPLDYNDDVAPVVDANSTAPVTNDARPGVNVGSGYTDTVSLYVDGVKVAATYDAVTGTLTPTADIADGPHGFTYTLTDAAGNESTQSGALDITIDTQAPTQAVTIGAINDDADPVQGAVANNGWTNDTSPTLSGTLSAPPNTGEIVQVLRDGVLVGTATVTGTTWTYADTGLADGASYTYTARVVDAAGNTGAISTGYTINVDATAPAQTVTITTVWDDVDPTQGAVVSGAETNDSTPEIRGSLSAALAGNEVVAVYRDGVKVGEATVTGTSWTYGDSGLANDTTYEYTARVEDTAGNTGNFTPGYSITVRTVSPSTSVTIDAVTDDLDPVQGTVANNGYTNDTTPTLSGTLSAALTGSEQVHIFRGGTDIGTATVTGTTWTYTDTLSVDGNYTYSAVVIDGANNQGTASNNYSIRLDATPPTQTVTITQALDDATPTTGAIAANGVTNDDTPEIQGTISAVLSSTEEVHVFRDGADVGTATVSGTNWTYTDSVASGSFYTYTAMVVDRAGNTSAESNSIRFKVDTSTITQTTTIDDVTDNQAPVTGSVANDGSTNDTSPLLSGTISALLNAGETLQVLRDGALVGTATVTGTTWTFEDTGLADGDYTYQVRIINAATVTGGQSNQYTIHVDTAVPAQTVAITGYVDNEAPKEGTFAFSVPTNDTTPQLQGTLSATLAADEVVAIYRDNVRLGTATVVGGTAWTYQDSGLADSNSYSYYARVEDLAGNRGANSTTVTLQVDATAPATPAAPLDYNDDVAPVVDANSTAPVTNDARPGINVGTGHTDTVSLYVDGVKVAATYDAVTGTLTPTADIADGPHGFTYTLTDAAGNESTQSGALDITIDTQAPTQAVTIGAINDDVDPVQGTVANNGYTNDTSPTLSGTLSAPLNTGETVQVLRGGVLVGTATVTGTTWTYADTGLADGASYTYTARVVDAAGNTGAISTGYTINVDATAPAQTVTITTVWDDVDPTQGAVANGAETNDSTPEIRGSLSAALAGNEVVAVYRDGVKVGEATVTGTSWTYGDSGLTNDTTYAYTARVEDRSGNTGGFSGPYSITVKTSGSSTTVTIDAITDDLDPVQGTVANNGYTNDTTPTLSGTLSAALVGTEAVHIFRGGTDIGTATVTGTTWTYTDTLSVDGNYTYSAVVIDGANNQGTVSNSWSIRLDTTPPTQTVTITQAWDDLAPVTGAIPANGVTNDDTPEIRGTISATLSATEEVHVFRDGVDVGVATVSGTDWTFTDSIAVSDYYTYTARVVDRAGNASDVSNSIRFGVNLVAVDGIPTIDDVTDNQAPGLGSVANDGSTNDTTPLLSGSLFLPLNAGETLQVLRDGVVVGTATVTGMTWTFEDTGLADGDYTYQARLINEAGVMGSMSNQYTIHVDTEVPAQTVAITGYADDAAPKEGTFAFSVPTNDTSPQLQGTLSATLAAGEVVAIYRDGTRLGTASVVGGTDWTFQDSGLADGTSYSYTARVEDAAGNRGASSTAVTLRVDTTAPATPIAPLDYNDDVAPVVDANSTAPVTNDARPGVNVGSGYTDTVSLYVDGVKVAATYDAVTGTLTPNADIADGPHGFTYTLTDTAGNESGQSGALDITIDTQAPTQAVTIGAINDDVDPVQGTVAHNGYTNDTSPTLSGTLSAPLNTGETVQVLRGGVLVGTATVTGTTWTYADTGLADGASYTYTARVVDAAGNTGAISTGYTINVDATAPAQTVTITTVWDDVDPTQGAVANGAETNDSTPEIRGSLSAAL
ncbi:Ig-like domain repeat protein, partial [Nitratidesulfovibrio termitidis]|uniref:Ig-like domain repeat protein n=1 Tax=Nitratidesulfovibrio termitidis TaxID=42252 RepID=UPI00055728CC